MIPDIPEQWLSSMFEALVARCNASRPVFKNKIILLFINLIPIVKHWFAGCSAWLSKHLRKILELGETWVKPHRVVATFSKSPTGLDLPHRPHLVDALSQLVPDVLHKAEEKSENREIFREVDQTWEAGCWTCPRERERRRCHLQREAVPPECPWTGRRSRSRGRWQGSGLQITNYKLQITNYK